MTTLTAPLIDRNLTAPERALGNITIISADDDYYITRAGSFLITRAGNNLVAHNNTIASPILLTAPLIDRNLTAQERND